MNQDTVVSRAFEPQRLVSLSEYLQLLHITKDEDGNEVNWFGTFCGVVYIHCDPIGSIGCYTISIRCH
jgi:hypothetical protein